MMTIEELTTKRQCGGCTLCCKLTPVEEIKKPANTRCQHQRTGVGCAIYHKRPASCRLWSCLWLSDPSSTKDLRRPDRVHYVLDVTPDTITMTYDDGRKIEEIVMQVWVDPKHPRAHRDPALRAMAEKHGIILLIRYGSARGLVLFPPSRNEQHEWVETPVNDVDFTRMDPFRKALKDMLEGKETDMTKMISGLLTTVDAA